MISPSIFIPLLTISSSQANILVDANGHAQLADFGLLAIGDITTRHSSSTGRVTGHSRYMAPEQINPLSSDTQRTTAADVYSFACVCIFVSAGKFISSQSRKLTKQQIYTGRQPFPRLSNYAVMFRVIAGMRPERPSGPECVRISGRMWTLITHCWAQQPTQRPSMVEIKESLQILENDIPLDQGID
jgi:serine/threonine protein kinase